MDNTAIAKDREILLELPQAETSNYQITQETDSVPLPNGRPIAANSIPGTDELLGYLD